MLKPTGTFMAVAFRTKIFRISVAIIVFTVLCVVLYSDDILITKFKCPNSHICSLDSTIPSYENKSSKSSLPLHFTIKFVKSALGSNKVIDVLFLFAHSDENYELRNKFSACLRSLLVHTVAPLHLHVITDNSSVQDALHILQSSSSVSRSSVEVTLYDVVKITNPLKSIIATMQPYFSYKLGAYYSDALFYVSIGIFQVLPLKRIVMLDVDVKFLDDIQDLYSHFELFQPTAVMGIAREQQPVYRHILHVYRRLYNDTRAGSPPPNGLTGFNSGVLLLDLQKMRDSSLYSQVINASTVSALVEKYKFKGHLGDQDFYSLVSFEHEELFYVLPCTWNRQLCQWWRRHGYEDVFDDYYYCSGKIKLLHGNCNTFIPN